ncbi:MAG: hypothetical protein IJT83_06250 [Victivallales bacterium]|nr:hypothetical protein [Victivallales bacterium]
MKITVLKSTVEAALAPILKMVANAKLPADFHPSSHSNPTSRAFRLDALFPNRNCPLSCPMPSATRRTLPSMSIRRCSAG